ncbi:restriction endonuclease subunit S [uncultured Fusobacterium sp.]|uniref:restriction endonuclease subunit S n=1 Tax=uncultured Fusobacterium sp. TaxID=159267 RepID=UPI0025E78441|nr:restriction endonuclease subunit S [uncultured Fusobacterium sp.]
MPKKKGELSIEERLEQSIVAKEEMPYKLPSNWVWTRLENLVSILGDGIHGTPIYDDNGEYYFINGNNLNNGNILIKETTKKVNKEEYLKYKKNLTERTVFISINGTLGNLAFYNNEKIILGKSACYFNLLNNINKKFIYHFLKTDYFSKYAVKASTGSTIKNLSLNAMKKTILPLPPLEEQKRIVKKLDSLFEKIQKIKEIIEEVKEKTTSRREAILSKAFSGELTEKWRGENHSENARELLVKINDEKLKLWEDECKKAEDEGKKKPAKPKLKTIDEMLVSQEEEPYKLPNNWVWIKLGELGEYKKGPFGSSLTKSMFVPKGENTIKVYEQKNAIQKDWKLGNYYITEEYFKNNMTSFEVKEKDIIVSCAGTIGETYILPIGIEKGIINQALMRITLGKNISEKYYLFYFDYILKKASNDLSNGSAIKNIPPFKIFKELGFALPPLEEQKEIVRVLDKVFEEENRISELISLENKIEILEKTILDRAFRGELGTGNSDDEPAIELLRRCLEGK